MAPNETKPLEQTQEFKDAVAAAVRAALPQIRQQLESEFKPSATAGDPMAVMQMLAMEISQLTDQGSGRKRVAPEIIKARAIAHDKMVTLINEAAGKRETLAADYAHVADGAARAALEERISAFMPRYRLRNKVHLDEQLVDPGWVDRSHVLQQTEIGWPGVPNEAMIPINEVARQIFAAFVDSIGSVDKQHQVRQQPLKATARGLIVKGAPSAVQHQTALDPVLADIKGEGLSIKHKQEPGGARMKEIQVLGTIAKPAQQGF